MRQQRSARHLGAVVTRRRPHAAAEEPEPKNFSVIYDNGPYNHLLTYDNYANSPDDDEGSWLILKRRVCVCPVARAVVFANFLIFMKQAEGSFRRLAGSLATCQAVSPTCPGATGM